MLYVIIILIAGWALYKYMYAKKIIGKTVSIKPFKKNSKLLHFGQIELEVTDLIKKGNDENWLVVPLKAEVIIGNDSFDFLIISPKSVDDNFNNKKAVVSWVRAGNDINPNATVFIDWGLVQVIK